jgi:Arm DNA-binding domain
MLTIKTVEAISPGKTAWDEGRGAVTGFGARRQTGDAVAYVVKYRTLDGRQRWHTIGRHGSPWTPDLARAEARRILGEVTKGLDPAEEKREGRKAPTLAELCDQYLETLAPAGSSLGAGPPRNQARSRVTSAGSSAISSRCSAPGRSSASGGRT